MNKLQGQENNIKISILTDWGLNPHLHRPINNVYIPEERAAGRSKQAADCWATENID